MEDMPFANVLFKHWVKPILAGGRCSLFVYLHLQQAPVCWQQRSSSTHLKPGWGFMLSSNVWRRLPTRATEIRQRCPFDSAITPTRLFMYVLTRA